MSNDASITENVVHNGMRLISVTIETSAFSLASSSGVVDKAACDCNMVPL